VRRGSVLKLVTIGVLFGAAATAVAYFIPWLPTADSKEADRIHFVFWFTTAICIAIFALVAAVIVYSVMTFRAGPDDESDGLPLHGSTGLEIVWTAVPAVLVTAISIVAGVVLVQNSRAGNHALRVNVTAQQFVWSFQYPSQGNITSPTLNIPVDRSIELHLKSVDVIHSFWVPNFGQKQDAVPGIETKLVVSPTHVGTFPLICTELCGLGHALMRTNAVVSTTQDWQTWVKQQQQAANGPPGQAGLTVFNAQGCGSCHTLSAAKTTGTTGPDLDNLPADAQKAGKPLEPYVRESITDPNAYVVPGFAKGVMPQTYAQLPKDQLDALVQYLVTSTQKGSK
jgi:cytochrome c oxidase subunit 2